jgi:hypothetical protein
VRGERRIVVAVASAEWSGVVIWRRIGPGGVIGAGTGPSAASLHREILIIAGDSG